MFYLAVTTTDATYFTNLGYMYFVVHIIALAQRKAQQGKHFDMLENLKLCLPFQSMASGKHYLSNIDVVVYMYFI